MLIKEFVACWLVKSGVEEYSVEQFKRDGKTLWVGVRNHLAKKHLKEMKIGDEVLFYHSQGSPSAVVALARVSKEADSDPTQFEKGDYFEKRATDKAPVWFAPELQFVKLLPRPVELPEIKKHEKLKSMVLLKASRLSVQPVSAEEFKIITRLANHD